MAIQNILPDLTHIARTTYQWEHTADKYEIIPNGVLCIEFVKVDQTLIKIGDGHHIYKQLPYVSSIDLKNYYTKEETDNRIIEIFNELKSIRIKGEVSDLSNLPTDNNTEGDLWFVRRTSPTGHSRYDEYVWYKNNWESIGLSESDIDLSEYAKKEYVDEKIEEVDEKIDRYMHTHSNKEILDQITAPFTTEKDEKLESLHNYDDTEIRRIIDERTHTHSNKSILDQTSAAYTTDKDNKLASLENYDDTAVQDRLEILERIAHFHENQEILNRTTAAFTREQAITLLDCKDFEGTDGTNDGYHGFVPAPTAEDAGKVLGANGQWVNVGGGGGGDTVAEGGGISITTDAQTGNKVIAVNAGTGLSIDPITGELNVTGGGGEGNDNYIAGEAIEFEDNASRLPSGYTELESISNTSASYIDTGYIPNTDTQLSIVANIHRGTTSWQTLFGARDAVNPGGTEYAFFVRLNDDYNFYPRITGDQYTYMPDQTYDEKIEISIIGTTATVVKQNGTSYSYTQTGSLSNLSTTLAIFALHNQTGYVDNGIIDLYSFKIYENNVIVKEFVPCKRNSDNVIGLFDIVNNVFYTNQGTGTFTAGRVVTLTSINVKYGNGLTVNQNNELEVTGGGGGDTIDEGGGISITTDPQTGVKTISVNVGDNLEVDQVTGELNVTGVDYTAGKGIFIGNEYQNVEYIKNSGNYDQIILTDIIPAFSDKIELDIKFGAPSVATVWDRPIMGCNGTTPSTFLYTVTLYLASNDSNLGCYNHFKYETGNTGRNFFIRPSGISYDGSSSVRKTLTMKGSTATWGTDSKEFSSEYNSSFIDPQIGIAVFGRAGQSSNTIFNSCELTVYGVKLYDSNDTLLHNLVPVKKLSNNEGGLYDTVTNKFYGNSGNGSFVTGPAVETDDRIINAKIGDGLQFDSNNAIEVNTGDGLSVNQDNELEVSLGNGLQFDQSGNVEIDPSIIPDPYDAGNGIQISQSTHTDEFNVQNQEYFFDTRGVTCQINARVYTTHNDGDLLAAVCVHNNGGTTVPLYVGLTQDVVKISQNYDANILGPNGSFDYLNKTWYYTADYSLSGRYDDALGHLETMPTTYTFGSDPANFVPAAKDLIDLAVLLPDTLHPTISAKIGTGLAFDANGNIIATGGGGGDTVAEGGGISITTDAQTGDKVISVNAGSGLEIDPVTGELNVIGGGSGGGGNYSAGEAIELDDSQLSFNVDAIRWDVSDIKNTSQGGGSTWMQIRYIEFCNAAGTAYTIDSGSGIWEDNTAVEYSHDPAGGGSQEISDMIANVRKMCATWRYPDHTMKLTFMLHTVVPVANIAKFRIKLGDDVPERDPKEWRMYVRNASDQSWHLVQYVQDAGLSNQRNVWSDYFEFNLDEPIIINVKYGDGLSIDENGALSTTQYVAGDGIEINPYEGLVVENTEYYFDTQVSCEIHGSFNRTFQKTTADPALGVIWKCYDGGNLWGGPLFVGLTADAVKYTTEGTTYNAKGTFNYLGRTWYYSDTSYYVQNPQDQDYLGNLQVFTDAYDYVTDEVDAAKRLIDAAHVYNNLDEISVKIGQRLKIESDGSVNAKGYLEGEGISIDTSDYLLPTGYTRIKALSSTLNGNQYINTGYKLKPDTTIDMKCTLYKRGTSVWAIPLGGRVYNSYAVGGMLFVTTNSDNLVPSTGVDTPSLWIESSLNYPPSGQINLWYNDIIDLHFDNQSVTCENQRTHEQSVITSQTAISATSSYDLYVFATNNGNNAAFFGVMDLYELTISENNVIIHRYIPCKRDSDDKYGLYDIIDNEFKLSPNNNLFSYVPGLPIDDINETISLLPATTTTLGGVKIGEGLSVDSEGYVSSKLYEAGQGITFDEAASEGQFKVRNLEYYFDNQVSLQIDGSYGPRTFTRVSQYEQCLIAIVQTTFSGQMWTTPACIGLTETSCKYSNSYDSYIIGPDATFDYKGYTWYIGMNYGLMNSTGVDLLGNVQGPIDLTSIDTGGGQNLDLVGKAIIDLAGLVVYEESIDVWNSGTGWLNGAYNDSQSDQFWTNWYYTYHSKQDEYLEVPAGAIKMRLIGISNENDSRLQGGGVDCFNSSHHHFTTVGCMTDEWADIPDGTVYLQFGVKWNELNDRTISSSDIKSVNIEFYYDTPRNDVINAKLGNGLEFDSNDAIRVKLGDGLGFDANGALEVTGGGGGDSIDEGAGIEITTDPLTDVKTISINYGTGLTVDPITNALMVDGQLPEGTIIKKMTFMGNGNGTSHTISFEKKPLAILSIYGSSGTNYIAAIPAPIDAPYLQGNYGGVSTNGQSCSCAISYNDATNELTFTQAYYGGSDSGLIYNANNVTYTVYYLIKGHTGSGTSATNEVSVIKTFSYVGTGTATNNIQFPETPELILDIHGPLGANGDITTAPIDIKHPSTTSQYTLTYSYNNAGYAHMGRYSFNDTTNVLTLVGNDYGASMNYNGYTYYVDYIVNEVISTTMPYDAGEAISIETIGGLQPTNYSNDDFVDSIMSMNAGTIVKAADKSSFTLTASSDDCYTRGASGEANGSYPFNVKASTKYRFAWDSSDPTVHGKVYTYENGLYDAMMHEIDQYDSSYLEFTTSANTTFIQARFGVMYAGNSITYSNVRLYEVIEDEDQYNEISVKYGDGLTVNERNELEVKYGNGLEIVSNTQYRPEYYFNTQVQCQVHTDSYYSTSASFDRTYQKTTTEPALCCIWEVGDSGALWTGPLLVGTTATSVQYTTQDTSQTVNYQNTFTYLGQTWYTSGYPDFLNAADHEDKLNHLQYLGSYTAVSDQIQAATDLINLALINAGSLQAKLGNGLSFDANGAIQVTGGGGGGGDTVAQGNGISITTDAQTGNKVIAVNAGTGLAFDQTTHALEVSSGVVTSIAPTQNTPGAITITEGDGTTSSVQVLSAMGGATSSTAGTAGYVPAPASGDDDAYLRGDGTWDDDVVTENDLLTLVFVPDDYTPPTP